MANESLPDKASLDGFVEEYQKKLRKLHKMQTLQTGVVQPTFSHPVKGASLSDYESQLIKQFREYKDIQEQLQYAKDELQRVHQIQASVTSLKDLEAIYADKKDSLAQEFEQQKQLLVSAIKEFESVSKKKKQALEADYLQEKTAYTQELEALSAKKKALFTQIETDSLKKSEDLQIIAESTQMQAFESLQIRWSLQQSKLVQSRIQKEKVLDDNLKSLNDFYDLKLKEIDHKTQHSQKQMQILFHEQQGDIARVTNEQRACMQYELDQISSLHISEINKLSSELKLYQQRHTDHMLAFSVQKEEKRQFWELEKTSISEHIAQERYKWHKDRDAMLEHIASTEEKHKAMWSSMKEAFAKEKEEFAVDRDEYIKKLELKKTHLYRDIQKAQHVLEQQEFRCMQTKALYESAQMINYEQQQRLRYETEKLESSLKAQLNSRNLLLKEDYEAKKAELELELVRKSDQKELEFSQRLTDFEAQLTVRRQRFEEELNERKQHIIETAKRDQKVEIDHLLASERQKHENKIAELDTQFQELTNHFNDKDKQHQDVITEYKSQINDLQLEKEALSKDVLDIESRTRKQARGTYEDVYKEALDKSQEEFKKLVQTLRESNQALERNLKQKELELSDMTMKLKKVTAQLDRYVVAQVSEASFSSLSEKTPKIVRSQGNKRL